MKHGVLIFLCLLGGALSVRAQTKPLRSAGTDFWTAFPTNDPVNVDPASLTIFVTAESTSVIRTTTYVRKVQRRWIPPPQNRWGFTPPYDSLITRVDTVETMGTLVIPIDTTNNIHVNGTALPYTVHIVATKPVRVFTLSHKYASSDGVTAFPTTMLDTEYVLIAHQNEAAGYRTYASMADFIAVADSTFVTITPSARLNPAGAPTFTVMLRKGQVYQIIADTNFRNADLTGTIVTGNKPFAVISGIERAYVNSVINGQKSRDLMIEQMLPVKYFGRTYLFGPTNLGVSPNLVRAVAAFDSTVITINDSTRVLNRGQYFETSVSAVTILRASKPILAVEEEPSSDNGLGDPDMTMIPPMRGYDSLYVVYTPQIRDTLSDQVKTTFLDTTYWRDTTLDNVNRRIIDTTMVFDSTVFGSGFQYTIATTFADTLFSLDSVYVHNMRGTKTFMLDNIVFYDNHLTAILRTEDMPGFRLDGTSPPSNMFLPTPYCGYVWFTTKSSYGTHVVSAPHGFSLQVFGYGTADSYGHLAGLRIGADDSIATADYAFGNQRVRRPRQLARLVRNLGINSVNIIGATIVGRDAAFFSVVKDSLPRTLVFNDSLAITVQFTPDAVRTYAAYLQLCTDISIIRVPLSGTGIASRLRITPPVTDWKMRKAPGSYDSTVTILNFGNDSVLVNGLSMIGFDTTIFSADSLQFTLQPGESRIVKVHFHPMFSGSFSNDIAARSDSPFDSTVSATLQAQAAGRVLIVDSIDYRTRVMLSPAVDSQAFVLNGSNTQTATITGMSINTVLNATQFQILNFYKTGGAPMTTYPVPLGPGDTLWVKIRFTPSLSGPAQARIVIAADVPSDDILLTAKVTDIVNPDLAGLNLDTLCVNSAVDTSVVLRNLGTSSLDILNISTTDPAVYTLLSPLTLPITVQPGAGVPIRFRAAPQRGMHAATMTITYRHFTDTSTITSQLALYGLQDSAALAIEWRSSAIAVGDTRTYCMMIHNIGDRTVTLDSVITLDTAHFRIVLPLPGPIDPGDSACVQYKFLAAAEDSFLSATRIFAHGYCGLTTNTTTLIGLGQQLRVGIDSVVYASVFSCTQRLDTFTVFNYSPFDADILSIVPTDPTAPFTIAAQLPLKLPAGGSVAIPVTFAPMGAGTYSTDFVVTTTPRDTTLPLLHARVTGSSAPIAIASGIDSTYHATPGSLFYFYLRCEPGMRQLNLHSIRGSFSFDPTLIQVLDYYTTGTALDGFVVDTFAVDKRRGIVIFHAYHPTTAIGDDTLLLRIQAMAFLGLVRSTPLLLQLEFPDNAGACVSLNLSNGKFTTDSVCGMPPVIFTAASTLEQNVPNPVSDFTTISLHLKTAGHVMMEMFDQVGRRIVQIIDRNLPEGTFSTTVDAGNLAPGLYYYRATTPEGTIVRQMLIMR